MRPIPKKLRDHLATLPRMKACTRRQEGGCGGKIEWHHAIIYQGRQLNEEWAIVASCHEHHVGSGKNDAINRLHAYKNIEDEELMKYKLGSQMVQEKNYLISKYQ